MVEDRKAQRRNSSGGGIPTPRALIGLAICYPMLVVFSLVLKPAISIPSAIYPPLAVAFSAYHRMPAARWPMIALVTTLFDLLTIYPVTWLVSGSRPAIAYTLMLSLSSTLNCVGMVTVFRISRLSERGIEPSAALAPLMTIALILGALPGDMLSTWLHAHAAHQPIMALDLAIRNLSSILTVVALCPLIIGLMDGFDAPIASVSGRHEPATVALTLAILCLLYFWVPWTLDRFLELMLLAGPVLWMALRCSRRAVAIVSAAVAVGIGIACAHGLGRFPPLVALGTWRDGILSAQLFLLITCGEAVLTNRIVLKQRALLHDSRRKQAMLTAYGKALDETDASVRRGAARDLHAGVAQILAGQSLILGALRRRTADTPLCELVDQALGASREALSTVRATIEDLSPPELDHAAPHEILAWITEFFAQRHRFAVTWSASGTASVSPAHRRLLYRVIRELVYNAYKHSQVGTVHVMLSLRTDGIELAVSDHGIGFDPASPVDDGRRRLGLAQLAERVAVAGGSLDVRASIGKGCRVTLWLPRSG